MGHRVRPLQGSGHFGYEYIAQALNHASGNGHLALGEEFFAGDTHSVAHSMITWDHENLGRRDMYGSIVGAFSSTVPDSDPVTALMNLMDRPEGADALTGEAAAEEARRFEAVQQFMADDTAFKVGDNPMNMTRYLTGHRMTDQFTGTVDFGESLGRVIAQTTAIEPPPTVGTPEHDAWVANHEQAAHIAGNFLFGYQDGLDKGSLYHGENTFGMQHSMLRSWAGVILAPHMEGIAESLNSPDDAAFRIGPSGFGTGESIIRFDDDMKQRLLDPKNGLFVDLAFDRPLVDDNGTPDDPTDDFYVGGRAPAIQNLVMASQAGYQDELRSYLGGGSIHMLDASAGKWGSVIEALTTAPPGADSNVAAAIDEQNRALQGLVSKGIGLVPFGDLIDSKFANYLIGQAKGNVQAPLLEALLPTNHAAEAAGGNVDAHNLVEVQMRQSLYQVLSTDGVWDSQPGLLQPSDWTLGPSFTDASGNVIPYDQMSTEQQRSFRDYVTAHVGQGDVYSPRIDGLQDALNRARLEREEAR